MHNSTHIMHKNAISSLRVCGAGIVEIHRDVPLHQHPMVELVYYLRGHVQCRISDTVVECPPGMLRLMPPRVNHGEIVPSSFTCLYIMLEASQLAWPQLYLDDSYGTCRSLCQLLVREWNGQARDREEMLDSLVFQLDILMRRANDREQLSEAEQLVLEGERLLKERSMSAVTIREVAETLRVSPSLLRAQFVRLRGYTPMSYLQSLRVGHALALIRNSNLSLEAIAHLCGYDSASHLSRHVKGATGKRPGSFRLKDDVAA